MKTNLKLRVSFYTRHGKTSKEEQSPIMLRVSYNGERTVFGQLPLTVSPKHFLNSRATDDCPGAVAINKELANIEAKINVYAEELYNRKALSLESLKVAYFGDKVSSTSLTQLIDEFIEKETIKTGAGFMAKGTLTKHRRFGSMFLSFVAYQYKRKDMLVTEITEAILSDYELYLEAVAGYSHNTLIKYLRFVLGVMRYAKSQGYIRHNPVERLTYKERSVDRGFLTTEELRKVEDVTLNPHLNLVRDVFLFSCYTGISYRDVFNLTDKNILTNNGHKWIVFRRQKTNNLSQVFLLDKALGIIEKYNMQRPSDGRLLPVFCNQVINRDLKKIAGLCGIEKNLTYHLARHTFATFSLTNGVSMETVSKTLGHSSLRTTQIYARILPCKMEAELSRLNGVL